MTHFIVIDPALDITAAEFAEAWNDAPDARSLAEAQAPGLSPKGYPIDPELLQQGLIILKGLGVALAGGVGALVLDALKKAAQERLEKLFADKLKAKPKTKIEWEPQPDGGLLMIITQEE